MSILAAIAQPPVDAQAPETAMWLFTAFVFALAAVGLVWAAMRWVRGDRLLATMFASALIASLNEPMIDHLGHLWYPHNLPFGLYTTFGVQIPALVPPAYAFFGGVSAYFTYTRLKRGITVRGLMLLWVVLSLDDLVLEYPGVSTDVYSYFGAQPFELLGYPWWWCPLAGCAMLVPAFMLHWLEPRLVGIQRAGLLLVMPMGVLFTYGALGWPTFLALNTDLPEVVRWTAAAMTAGLCVLVAYAIAQATATDGAWRRRGAADRSPPPEAAPAIA